MKPELNPFSPGAGSPPPELVGRDEILAQVNVLFARTLAGRAEKSLLLTGLRGVGKTVLLNEIQQRAEDTGFHARIMEAHEEKSLPATLVPHLRSLLFALDRVAAAREKVRRGFAALKSFVSKIRIRIDEVPVGLDIDPAPGVADSGDLELDLPDIFAVVGDAARTAGTGVAMLIDEVQYFQAKELSALIMGMHRMQQRQLPLVLIGAGLPVLPRLAGESKTYAERLFQFPRVDALPESEAGRAIRDPINDAGESITDEAIDEIFRQTQGYPYFIQEWGYQTWNAAEASPIGREVVVRATQRTIGRLDESFFRVRYDRLTPAEQQFLRAMAETGSGPYRISEVADLLGVKVSSLSPRRAKLINKGMIYSPQYGELAFTVPLFDEFMRRTIPDFQP